MWLFCWDLLFWADPGAEHPEARGAHLKALQHKKIQRKTTVNLQKVLFQDFQPTREMKGSDSKWKRFLCSDFILVQN